jgi:hypothetical protein
LNRRQFSFAFSITPYANRSNYLSPAFYPRRSADELNPGYMVGEWPEICNRCASRGATAPPKPRRLRNRKDERRESGALLVVSAVWTNTTSSCYRAP